MIGGAAAMMDDALHKFRYTWSSEIYCGVLLSALSLSLVFAGLKFWVFPFFFFFFHEK